MSMQITQVDALLAPTIEALGLSLWGCEYAVQDGHKLLRIYIDSPHGVTIEDCSKVSREIRAILAVEAELAQTYGLEVSSPGLERQLFKREQYRSFLGKWLAVQVHVPLAGRRRFKGLLAAVDDTAVTLSIGEETVCLPLTAIAKAHVVLQE
jgi:ribosome maturation factor RimP